MKLRIIILLIALPIFLFAQKNYEKEGDVLMTQKQYEKAIKKYRAAIEVSDNKDSLNDKLKNAQRLFEESQKHYLNLDMVGNIGTSRGTLVYNEKSDNGYYTYILSNTTIRRNIVLYQKTASKLLLKSYDLSGKYIGTFNGVLNKSGNNMIYYGTFTNYKGASVKFKLKQK